MSRQAFYAFGQIETYYMDHRGGVWLVQSPDMTSDDPVAFDELPEGCVKIEKRLLEQDWHETAATIDRNVCEGTLRVDGDTAFILLGLDYKVDQELRADAIEHIAKLYRTWLSDHDFDSMEVVADKRSDYGSRIDRDSAEFWSKHEDDLNLYVADQLRTYEVAV